ncbi:hypothetical protein TNIN_12111 [Trichonephila inaurata madagascariensis]|uniref:Uncharacterized protein n=1 Tax=Trichonephila inaurata madagascariensis TaxID=2747483 RepID=A0A8X6XAE7_9ARAC|nr:hypothetical protein TNIN_12111 [Trichonephila inaurata madagascariensis]
MPNAQCTLLLVQKGTPLTTPQNTYSSVINSIVSDHRFYAQAATIVHSKYHFNSINRQQMAPLAKRKSLLPKHQLRLKPSVLAPPHNQLMQIPILT